MKRLILGCATFSALVACSAMNSMTDGIDLAEGNGAAGQVACRVEDLLDAGVITPAGPSGCGAGSMLVYERALSSGGGGSGIAAASSAADAGAVTAAASFTADAGDGFLGAMATACAPVTCAAGQVGVLTWSQAPTSPTSTAASTAPTSTPDDSGATSTSDAASSDASALLSDAGSSNAGDAAAASSDASTPLPLCPGYVITCIDAPPTCPSGQTPSYAPSGHWHCMPTCNPNDPSMVVISYGSEFGAQRVCTSGPPSTPCSDASQVWTWDYQDETWVCRDKCDNGTYDQHDWAGQTVCIPC
jgi:hypothetical protein